MPYTPPKTLAELDAELARIAAKRRCNISWAPPVFADGGLMASHAVTGPYHSWDREDAEASAPVVAPVGRRAA